MEKYVAYIFVGFDFLGCAVDGLGDSVSLSVDSSVHPGQISISHISGNPCSKLSRSPLWNCAGIAAIEIMKMLGTRSVGLSLSLHKDLPLDSGLGSSAASAASVTVNEIFGGKLGSEELVLADNVGLAGNLRLYCVWLLRNCRKVNWEKGREKKKIWILLLKSPSSYSSSFFLFFFFFLNCLNQTLKNLSHEMF